MDKLDMFIRLIHEIVRDDPNVPCGHTFEMRIRLKTDAIRRGRADYSRENQCQHTRTPVNISHIQSKITLLQGQSRISEE
jgi:hypothetical protein